MPVPEPYQSDLKAILEKRRDNGGEFWATADGRWGVGSPFSTFDCAMILTELGVARSDPVVKGMAGLFWKAWQEDGRIRPAPKGAVYPCHTANAARALCRLGFAKDRRLARTFEHFIETQHDDGGWRCNTVKLGQGPITDASNPGVTLSVLDAFRFTPLANTDKRLDSAVRSLLDHWNTRRPLGPCSFGIGSLFTKIEYPFLRYNLFMYVYVLSFYKAAHNARAFKEALQVLESKQVNGNVVVENPNRRLAKFAFCKKGEASQAATRRYREIGTNLDR